MNIWLLTDTHFGHKNIIKYCDRPENYDELILENLNVIKEGDILYHLGDFCFGNESKWHEIFFEKLKGVKCYLIKGNHDKRTDTWYINHGWTGSFKYHYFSDINVTLSHAPIENILNTNIHGHFHNHVHHDGVDNYDTKIYKLISIENEDYKPVLLSDFLKR